MSERVAVPRCLTNQLQNFAQNVLHERQPPVTIDDGFEALRIAIAATRARETGTTVTVADVKPSLARRS
jgi:predicted dehydrogenase